MKVLLLLAACAALTAAYDWTLYSGHKIVSVTPETVSQLNFLRGLNENSFEYDFGKPPSRVGEHVEMRVPPNLQLATFQSFAHHGLHATVLYEDYGERLRQTWENELKPQMSQLAYNYSTYNTLDQINTELNRLAANCVPGFTCTVDDIGVSIEGRAQRQLHVSSNKGKPAVWLDATIHSREWMATATLMSIMNRLMSNYGSDPDVTHMLNEYDWFFMPVANPDGYEYTWDPQGDRDWRKNRRQNPNPINCWGVDLNRNFDFNWGDASDFECSINYRGSSAASEPETANFQDRGLAVSATTTIIGAWSIHAFGNYMLVPYGNGSYTADWTDQETNVAAVCAAIEATYNTNWQCGNTADVLYEVSGATLDWAKGVNNVKYSFSPEVRGTAFDPPTSEIPLSYLEMWNGLVAFVNNF